MHQIVPIVAGKILKKLKMHHWTQNSFENQSRITVFAKKIFLIFFAPDRDIGIGTSRFQVRVSRARFGIQTLTCRPGLGHTFGNPKTRESVFISIPPQKCWPHFKLK
jgi:hypothetical protein